MCNKPNQVYTVNIRVAVIKHSSNTVNAFQTHCFSSGNITLMFDQWIIKCIKRRLLIMLTYCIQSQAYSHNRILANKVLYFTDFATQSGVFLIFVWDGRAWFQSPDAFIPYKPRHYAEKLRVILPFSHMHCIYWVTFMTP